MAQEVKFLEKMFSGITRYLSLIEIFLSFVIRTLFMMQGNIALPEDPSGTTVIL